MAAIAAGAPESPMSPRAGEGASLVSYDPRKLIVIFLRRARTFVAVAVVVFVCVLAFAAHHKRVYGATSNLLVEPRQSNLLRVSDAQSAPADSNAVDTVVQLLTSQTLAARVADKLNLYADPEFNTALSKPGVRPAPAKPGTVDQNVHDAVIGTLLSHVQAHRAGLTSVVLITATSRAVNKAPMIANAFATAFIQMQLDAKYNVTHSANAYLSQQLSDLQHQVEAADAAVQQYKISHNLMSADGATMAEQEVSTLNQQIASAQADSAEKEARLRAAQAQVAQGGGGADVGAALGSDTIRTLRAQEAEASQRLADLSTRYGPKYPDVQKTESQLRDTRAQIQAEINRIMSSLRADVQVANQRAASLRGSEGSARGGLASNNQAQVGLMQLQSRADANRAIYEAVLNRSKETSAQEGIQQPDARLVSEAQPNTIPVSPNMKLAAAMGAVLALGCGLAAVILLELFDGSLRTSTDVEDRLGVPYAGGVPTPASTGKMRASDRKLSPPDYLLKHPFSSFAEAFRSLRAFMLLTNEGEAAPKIIAITSALPKEGKSVTSFCLMRTLAQAGAKVVLVDCDLRRRGVSQFIAEPSVGLIEVLDGQASLQQALVRDEPTGGWVLPVRAMPSSAKDYFSTVEMDQLLKTLAAEFDMVILDTPPTLALADARTIASKADRTLFLAHWGRTQHRAIEAALGLLHESGANIAGVSLTRVDMRRQAAQGYGDSSYYYKQYRSYYTS